MDRGTPTVDGDRIYAMSGQGDSICDQGPERRNRVVGQDARLRWHISQLGFAEPCLKRCPTSCFRTGGRNGAIVALDKLTGNKIWQSKYFTDAADYSSIIVGEHNGTRQYIQLTQRSVVGVAADDGRVLLEK